MEFTEEVHSDAGSYELVDFDDMSSKDLPNDDSYDFLSSEEDGPNNTTVNHDNTQIKSSSLDSPNLDSKFQDLINSDSFLSSEEEGPNNTTVNHDNTQIKCSSLNSPNLDSKFQDSINYDSSESKEEDDDEEMEFLDNNLVKKQNLMAMAYKRLKEEIKIKDVAKTQILHYFPAKFLARCKAVSKEWNSWISNPFFTHSQSQNFNQTSGFFRYEFGLTSFISLDSFSYGVPYPSLGFLPKKVSIKSSCNGLLLCEARVDENESYVCNPANKQFIKLPKSGYYHGEEAKIVLAFEPSSLNFEPHYQVLCPFSVFGEGPILYFDIYDSNTQSWRASDVICVDLDVSDLISDGVFINGVVYWETTGGKLLAFDLKNEIYSVQTLPVGGTLSKVHGELGYVKGHYCHSSKTCILDVYQGDLMSLKMTMSFDASPFEDVKDGEEVDCSVLGNSCDDVVAVLLKKSFAKRLYVYRVKDEKVEGPWFLPNTTKLFPYVNSLVHL